MSSCAQTSGDEGPPTCGAELDAVMGLVPGELTEAELAEAMVVIDGLRRRLEAMSAAVTGVFDARRAWAADGARSAAGWMAARTDRSHRVCNAEVRLARALRDMPAVEAAALAGHLGREKVEALAWARREGLEEAFAAGEGELVADVAAATVAGAWRHLRRWVDAARADLGANDPDGPEPQDGVGGSKVTLGMAMEGRWFGTLDLRAEDGEIVAGAIQGLVDTWWRTGVFRTDDGLTGAERRARALVEVVTRGTDGGDRDGTAKPLVLALVDAATLVGLVARGCGRATPTHGPGHRPDAPTRTGPLFGSEPSSPGPPSTWDQLTVEEAALTRLCELSRSGPTSTATVQRLACEGAICPVVIGAHGDPLNMGREMRLFNREQRRALRIRDGHCVFAGCHAPAEACVAHHLRYWEHGGPTDVENGALVCPFHHRLLHDGGYRLRRNADDGPFTTLRPDGTPITGTRSDPGPIRRRRPPPAPPPDARPGDVPDPEEVHATRSGPCRPMLVS